MYLQQPFHLQAFEDPSRNSGKTVNATFFAYNTAYVTHTTSARQSAMNIISSVCWPSAYVVVKKTKSLHQLQTPNRRSIHRSSPLKMQGWKTLISSDTWYGGFFCCGGFLRCHKEVDNCLTVQNYVPQE